MRRLVIYKLELICVKYVPIIIALLSLLDNILMYYDISLDILSYIAGTSILTTIPMYISSYVYKFCKYHRMFIHYIVVNKVIAMVDNYIIIPLSDFYLLLSNMIIAGIFLFFVLYFHLKYGGRGNVEPKAFTRIFPDGYSMVVINSKEEASIIHEAEHVKNAIWEFIGYSPQVDNDEVDAYLLTYIYIKILEVFRKHDKVVNR